MQLISLRISKWMQLLRNLMQRRTESHHAQKENWCGLYKKRLI